MKKFLLSILAFILVIPGVEARHRKSKPKNDIQFISMHRSACFGRCPDYAVEVYKDGLVKYFGMNFVKDSGVYEKNIGAARVALLFNQFNNFRIDTCKDEYPNIISDLPGLGYKIKYSDREKNVSNAHFGPPTLKMLAASVDSIAQVDNTWTKLSDQSK